MYSPEIPSETPLNYQYTLKKMEDRNLKQVFSEVGYQWDMVGAQGKDE
jgi:hypothetical protein